MHFATTILLISAVPACAISPLQERLEEPDVAIPGDCKTGSTEIEVSGTVVDFTTGEPVAGARVDITEAWSGAASFPSSGCRLGGTTTDAAGRFGPLSLRALGSSPIVVFLVTGADRAPTISDTTIGCLFGCSPEVHDIQAPSHDLVAGWRQELYDGGMEYALNRGLVAYRFHDLASKPAVDVKPLHFADGLFGERRELDPGSEVRFLEINRRRIAPLDRTTTLGSGTALIGSNANAKGYFRVAGERGAERWASVGVIVATGWIYFESDSIDPP